jgi:DNA topoisomerase-1
MIDGLLYNIMGITTTSARRKWDTLEHNGIAFPPEYQPRGITIIVRGENLMLNREQEELVYAWAAKKDTHYVHDSVFQSNFIKDFSKLLPGKFQDIDNIKEIDFSEAFRLIDPERKI